MEQSNDNKYSNSYNLIAYMFDKPSKPKLVVKPELKLSKWILPIPFQLVAYPFQWLFYAIKYLHKVAKSTIYYKPSIKVAIVIIGLLAFTKFLNGINHSQPTQSSPTVAIEQPIAKIDSLAAQPEPQVINTVNLDNSLAKAKEVFDTFPEVEGESPVDNMKRMNQHIMDYSHKNK
ncbi:hypothetical protein [Methylovorus glucosotrophus]|uniref:Uncharacterized protein n=1 Tax=Methylovorus glucosotrophus (strain SIP3-4) TaxID=582744 RepID=C6X7X9_METGS|nr:hypothetical protein [Methylovorus glucosotrophus]ACT51306.1 hypothetical protein Msip34_2064 [Methylovorus glucosotrophus SIP3-4]